MRRSGLLGSKCLFLVPVFVLVFGGVAAANAETVKGTVTYLERMAVPPGAILEVQLLDVSRADAASEVLSSMRLAMARVPEPFELAYDSALIDARMSYTVAAQILVDGKTMYRSTQAYPVLTRGAADTVDIVVQRMASPAGASGAGLHELENTAWEVTDMKGRLLATEKRPIIRFAEDGAFAADSTCNKYAGKATISGASISFPEAMAGTRMACQPPYDKLETDFVKALGDVAGYVRNGDALALVNSAGVAVLRAVIAR